MFTMRDCLKGVAVAVVLGALSAGCSDVGMDVDVPLLDTAGTNVKQALMGKPQPEPNLQERAPLVMPPKDAPLPVPGQSPQAPAQ